MVASPTADPAQHSAAGEPLRSLLSATIVTIADRPWSGRDLVSVGALSGRWQELEHGLGLGLAALHSWAPAPAALAEAVRDFRYAHRLISADEFARWMHARELVLADVVGAARRQLARQQAPPDSRPDLRVELDAALAALPAEAVCSGVLRACGTWLIDRILSLDAEPAGTAADTAVEALLATEGGMLAASVLPEPLAVRRERAALLLRAQAAYERRIGEICSEQAIARTMRRHALDWSTFELASFSCPSAGTAAEVSALLREGTPPEQIGELSGFLAELASTRLEEAPSTIQGWLSAARPGDVLGPLADGDAHRSWLVQARSTPDPGDPQVRHRAAAEIVEDFLRPRRAGKVKWHGRD